MAFKDLTGMRFGRLTVQRRAENNKWGQAQWICLCDCGNETKVDAGSLTKGNTQSCGCLRKERARRNPVADLTGRRFGRLTAIERVNEKGERPKWLYCPENCRWVTMKAQCRNKRGNRIVEFNGVKKTVAEWSEITGIEYNTLLRRINSGWDVGRALIPPT